MQVEFQMKLEVSQAWFSKIGRGARVWLAYPRQRGRWFRHPAAWAESVPLWTTSTAAPLHHKDIMHQAPPVEEQLPSLPTLRKQSFAFAGQVCALPLGGSHSHETGVWTGNVLQRSRAVCNIAA